MSYEPGSPYQPVNYYVPSAPLRPASVTVLAIIGIVLASLQLLVNAGGLVMYALMYRQMLTMQSSQELNWNLGQAVIGLPMGLWLLIASIAALRLRPFGRAGMVWHSIVYIVWCILTFVGGMFFILPDKLEEMRQTAPQLGSGVAGIAYATFIGVLAITLIYPVCVLAWMRKPHVRAAFSGPAAAQAPQPGYAMPPAYEQPPQTQWPTT